MEDFVTWTDQNHLIDMPIVSSKFTWSNGRSGPHHTRKRLHKVIYNQAWVDACVQTSCSTLIKSYSYHYPILLHFNCQDFKFKSQFRFFANVDHSSRLHQGGGVYWKES